MGFVSHFLRFSSLASCICASSRARPPFRGPDGQPVAPGPQAPEYNNNNNNDNNAWGLSRFTTLVAFGDSYTDETRLVYFLANNGSAPPVGWVDPDNYPSADGGRPWTQYVRQYTGANVYNYAVSGAVCSNDISPRGLPLIHGPFPAVAQYEVPAYLADSKYVQPDGAKFLIEPVDQTVYAIWIGTNDLGVDAFLTDSQVAGTTLVNYTDCVFDQLRRVYENGGRNYVLLNVVPLDLAPLYAAPSKGGVVADHYWPDKPSNRTQISQRMLEQVAEVNRIYELETPFVARIGKDFEGARFALFDVHGLFLDIYNHPSDYLNGTSMPNVTYAYHQCDLQGGNCVDADDSPDGYLWYDDLHPSEQTERIVAENFIDVVAGSSKWATYW